MSTLEHIATWNQRNANPRTGPADRLDRNGRRYNGDRTRVAQLAEPLRNVAARQGAALKAAGSTGARDARLAPILARVEILRAERGAPTPAARPAVASVVRPTFKEVDALLADIPEGFYALPRRVDAKTGGQPVYYFKVHAFRGGKRIVMVTGGVGAFTEVPMRVVWQAEAARKIGADPREAAVLFGRETSTCGRCGSPLTNSKSRARGLGPDCSKAY